MNDAPLPQDEPVNEPTEEYSEDYTLLLDQAEPALLGGEPANDAQADGAQLEEAETDEDQRQEVARPEFVPKPLVAIVGRPNVGKSTLFNRLVGRRIAIVDDMPGITRDRLYAEGDWNGREYTLVDTGGIQMFDTDPLKSQIRLQAEIAMEEADVIVLVVDTTVGLTSDDQELANALRRSPKPLIVIANKVDNGDQENRNVAEVYALGLPHVFPVSALGGRGVADALDAIVERFPPAPQMAEAPPEDDRIKIAIIGRPNVGKSSLLNCILGEERAIVSPIAGTTRDSTDTAFIYKSPQGDREVVLIDTAGIRRAGKIQGSVEYYTVLRAVRAIERADVVMLVVDGIDGVTDGDKRVGGYAHEAGRAAIICVNKWDVARKEVLEEMPNQNPMSVFSEELRDGMHFLAYAPLAFTSATTGKGVPAAVEAALDAAEAHSMRIPTGELNRIVRDAVDAHPYNEKGKSLKIKYATMPTVKPPTIVLFVNDPELMHFSYLRYLENRIRETYSFEGTPLRIQVRKAAKDKAEEKQVTQIATMRFASLSRPEEHGLLALHDDGSIQVVPSDAMRDSLSASEEAALRRAHLFGTSLGLGLVALGLLAIGAGWAYGRIFGRLGYTLSRPRSLDAVSLSRTDSGGLRLTMRGASRLHLIQLAWSADEIQSAEAQAFLAKCEELRTRH